MLKFVGGPSGGEAARTLNFTEAACKRTDAGFRRRVVAGATALRLDFDFPRLRLHPNVGSSYGATR